MLICCASIMVLLYAHILPYVNFILGISDIIIGLTWKECYLNSIDVPIYLCVSGCVLMLNYAMNGSKINVFKLISLGILMWGMTIVWNTEQKDCSSTQYNYLYYRTTLTMLSHIVYVGFMLFLSFIGLAEQISN